VSIVNDLIVNFDNRVAARRRAYIGHRVKFVVSDKGYDV